MRKPRSVLLQICKITLEKMQMTWQMIFVITSQFFNDIKVQIFYYTQPNRKVKRLTLRIESSTWKIRACLFSLSLPLFFAKFDLCKLDLKVFTTLRLLCHCMPNRNSFLFCIVKPRRGRLTSHCFESEEKQSNYFSEMLPRQFLNVHCVLNKMDW